MKAHIRQVQPSTKLFWLKTLHLFKFQNFLDAFCPHTHTWGSLRTIQCCLFSSLVLCCIYFPNLEHREDNFPPINLHLNHNSPFLSCDANTRTHRHCSHVPRVPTATPEWRSRCAPSLFGISMSQSHLQKRYRGKSFQHPSIALSSFKATGCSENTTVCFPSMGGF